eukprot:scaffold322239_cov18-Tisochrysis_lutea.AAC.1
MGFVSLMKPLSDVSCFCAARLPMLSLCSFNQQPSNWRESWHPRACNARERSDIQPDILAAGLSEKGLSLTYPQPLSFRCRWGHLCASYFGAPQKGRWGKSVLAARLRATMKSPLKNLVLALIKPPNKLQNRNCKWGSG